MSPWTCPFPPGEHAALLASAQCLAIDAPDRQWNIYRPADLEELWQQMGEADFGPDERIPYWVELWPSSLLLVEWLASNAAMIQGRTCLDVGCGLGLSACTASSVGARVVGLDYALEALYYAGVNARENQVPEPLWVQMDWRFPGFRKHGFDFIWGGDIFYEKRFAEPLISMFEHVLTPGGRIWLAEPERSVSSGAWHMLRESGWNVHRAAQKAVPTEGYVVNINIWEAQKNL
ncbi:class I SAM-dependent methyltransferase [Desulfonatronum parangueonense]